MNRRTFGAAFAAGGTNLDLLRLAGALLVLMSHAWILTGHAEDEPFAIALGRYTDGGGLAVAMFFTISGFLIARSALIHPAPVYLRARAARIYPAFAVAVLAQTLLLGLAATTLPWATYLQTSATWDALFHALLFSPRLGLPGVFATNPFPYAVNGSLWTLRIEVVCYLGLLILARLGLLRRGWVLLPTAAVFALLAIRIGYPQAWVAMPQVSAILDCGLNFLMGAVLWCYRDSIPNRWWLAAAGLAALAAAAGTPFAPELFHLLLPYLVFCIGLSRALAPNLLRRLGDISYGTYLYAFPIEQAVVAIASPIGPLTLIAIAAPLTLLCGLLSRRFIERPALRWMRRHEQQRP